MRNWGWIASIMLAACAAPGSDWQKQGATPEQLAGAKTLCHAKAEEVFPVNPQMISAGWDSPPRRECVSGSGGNMTCTNIPGTPAPPRLLDANEVSRKKGYDACMKALGWSH